MIDDLDLSYEDEAPGRHRRRRKGGGGGRTLVAGLLVVLVLGGLVGGAWWGIDRVRDFFTAPDYNTGGTGEVVVVVKERQTATDIGNTLFDKKVVKSAKAFSEAAKADPRSTKIQPGKYKLRQQMRAKDALAMLLDLNNRWITKVTIPEGKSVKETFDLLSKETKIPVADFQAAAKDPVKLGVPDYWFKVSPENRRQPMITAEGFLFPSTYEFDPEGITAEKVLKVMVAKFIEVTTELGFVDKVQQTLKITPFEALVVASLAQAEAGIKEDLGKVARVAYNRVYKNDMPLEFDVCANYWLELNGKPRKPSNQLTVSELDDPSNPYNVKSKRGLPAGPIQNPGKDALQGAMAPPEGKWLFFVLIDKSGRSAFAETLPEHDRNTDTAKKNGVG